MSVAPPARRTVTEIWRACSASGKREINTYFCPPFVCLSSFVVVINIICVTAPYLELSKSRPVKLLFVIPTTLRQHLIAPNLPVYPINLLPPTVPGSPLFCIFLKGWLCFSNCNCALLLFSNGDCMPTNLFSWHHFDRYRGHVADLSKTKPKRNQTHTNILWDTSFADV